MSFEPGQFVLINGGLLAEIVTYNEDINLVVYKSTPAGGGSEIHTDHISHTRVEAVPQLPFEKAVDVDADSDAPAE